MVEINNKNYKENIENKLKIIQGQQASLKQFNVQEF